MMKGAKLMALAGLAGAAVVSGLAALMKNDVMKSPLVKDAAEKEQEEEVLRRRAAKRKDDYFRKQREEAARQARNNNHD